MFFVEQDFKCFSFVATLQKSLLQVNKPKVAAGLVSHLFLALPRQNQIAGYSQAGTQLVTLFAAQILLGKER